MHTALRAWRFCVRLGTAFGLTVMATLQAGTLTGAYQTVPQSSQVNLSQIGALDWVHWGTYTEFAFDRKAGVVPLISDYSLLGNPFADFGPFQYGDNYNGYSWNDGAPDATLTNTTTGVYLLGKNDGYQITVPADTNSRVLKVYVGAYGAAATFSASLSDGGSYSSSAVSYAANGPAGLYTLTYAAASSNQTLTVKFLLSTLRDRNFANVTLQAAALSYAVANNPPTVALMSPSPNASFLVGDSIALAASAFDKDGTITNVQFFAGTNLLGQSGGSPFTMTWSNAPLGQHFLTARAVDNGGAFWTSQPVTVFVTGTNGSLTGNVGQTSTNVVLSVEGTRDWAHWGLINTTSFDRKAGFTPVLPNFTQVGTGIVQRMTDDLTLWSWQGGTPHATATNSTSGVYLHGFTNGFELQLPASTNAQTVKVDIGVYSARGQMQAFLSDFSGPAFTDTSRQMLYGRASGVYTFNYAAGSANQKLMLRYTSDSLYDFDFGSVALLSSMAIAAQPTINLSSPTNGSVFDASTAILIQANAANSDGAIDSVTFYSDNTIIGTVTNEPFRMLWTNPVPGVATLQAIARDVFGGFATSAPVALTIISNPPPPVHLITPVNGDTFVAGTNISLEATLDLTFDAQAVEFLAQGVSLGQVTGPPFSLIWSNVAAGLYTLTARATDSLGTTTNSRPVAIAVDPNKPPSVVISAPTSGTVFHWSVPVTITASASDADGFISLTEIFDGDTKLAEFSGSSCTVVLSNSSSRVYSLRARATDNWLLTSTSAPVVVTITNLPPILAITNPTNEAMAWAGLPITLEASASDPDGAIQWVRFYEGTNFLGEVEDPPFNMTWSDVVSGIFTFTAIAADNDGATNVSSPISITVSNPAPVVVITNPLPNVVFGKFTNITIEADAGDTNGTVVNVAFFEGTNLLASVSSPPFSIVWTNVAPGHYTITAEATDNEGAVRVSPPVNVTVLNSSLTGDVSGDFQVIPEGSQINLSEEGPLDWVHWGTYTQFASDRKAATSPMISDISLLGDPVEGDGPFPFSNNLNGYTWWDGAPNLAVVNTTSGIYLSGLNHGFEIRVPSDMRTRVLKLYVGAYAGEATLSAYLSDGSGYSSKDLNYISNGPAGVYTVAYLSASSNQMLTVRYILTSSADPYIANCTLQAAALSYATENNPPIASITTPTQSMTFAYGDIVPITAIALDNGGTVTNVEFYAGTNRLGQSSVSPYTFNWTNAPLGRHVLTVIAQDDGGESSTALPVVVFVTASTGALTGGVSPTPSAVNLSMEGTRDWVHWGRGGATNVDRKAGVPPFFAGLETIGTNTLETLDDSTAWSWVSGTPTATDSNTMAGVLINGDANGFELQLPANTSLRTARVYVGVSSARGRMEAFLSDYSAPTFSDTSLQSVSGNEFGVFTFSYAAASTNERLIVRYTADSIFDWNLGGVSVVSASAVASPPSVAIIAPTNGAVVNCSPPPQIQTSATNVDGAISSVSFYRENALIGRPTNSPFTLAWSNAVPGSCILTAVATDMFGGTAVSAPVAITLVSNALPSVSLIAPAGGAVFFEHTNVSLYAQASDSDGSVVSVRFLAGTNLLGQVTSFPFSMVWSNIALGQHSLTAVAMDDRGDTTVSAPVNISVLTNKWPVVAIISPTNGGLFISSNITVLATASDSDGSVTLLELFDGAIKLTESTGTNLTFTWNNPPAGTRVLSVRAVDNWFGTNASGVTITVTNPPPSVTITNPVGGSVFFERTNITIRARASDTNGTVTRVEFFANTNSLGFVTNSPFNLVWSNMVFGSYSLTALATDNGGASTLSTAVNVTIVTNKLPTVSITAPTNGTIVISSSNFTAVATASDLDGTITLLELFDGATKLAQSSNSTLSFVVTNVSPGTHTLTARATDNWFGTNTSSAVVVTASNPPPSVTITNPLAGATFFERTNITIRARASDTNGIVSKVEFFANTNSIGVVTNAPFNIVWSNMSFGSYALTALATDNGGATKLSAAVNVTAITNKLPTVSLTAPSNGAVFLITSNITVKAGASDADGTITLIEIYDGQIKLTQTTATNLTFTWTNPPTGTHVLTARAVDNWFGTNTSAAVTVIVTNPPPSVTITNPAGGSVFFEHTNLSIGAKASDTNGTVKKVEFFANTNSLGTVTNSPYTIGWSNVVYGSYSLTAIATDNAGATTVSAAINITVVTNKLPLVSITAPTNGAIFFRPANVTVTATASDSDGAIKLLEVFDGATKLAQTSNSSLSITLTNATAGTHTLMARATDNLSGTYTSSAVIVIVTNPPPLISITNPLAGATFFEHTNVDLRAAASDSNGTVSRVEFFANTNSLGVKTNAPFSVTWSNVLVGSYLLTATAMDNEGASTVSAPMNVSVVSNQLPVVSIFTPTNNSTFYSTSNVNVSATAFDPDGSILSLEVFDGASKLTQSSNSSLTITLTNVSAGTHTLTVRAIDNWFGTNTASVMITVYGNLPPLVSITTPTNNAIFLSSSNVTVTVTASGNNQGIKLLELFDGATKLGQATNAALTVVWANAAIGVHTLTARATDSQLLSTTSAPVTIVVTNPPPSVAITDPVEGSLFLPNSEIAIQASASDSNGFVTKVEFFAGTNLIGQVTNAPYVCTWTNVPIGNYLLTASATDNNGGSSTSSVVNVVVSSNSTPLVEIIAPGDGSLFAAPASISITAVASDSDGSITLLEILDSTNRIAQSTNSFFTFLWTNAAVGLHTLTARGTDNRAGLAISAAIEIIVSNPPPSITITNPVNGAAFLAHSRILIQAQANDINGTVTDVIFYAGTQLIATVSSPFNYLWTNTEIGNYRLTAVAMDDEGATNRSAGLSIAIVKNAAAIRDAIVFGQPSYFDFPVNTQSNLFYSIEFAPRMDAGDWQTLTNLVGTGDAILVSDPIVTNSYRFYRIKVGAQ